MENLKGKKKREVDDKISIFGILSATKALTNPVKQLLEVETERLNVEVQIEKRLAELSKAQQTLTATIMRGVYALESRNSMLRR